MREIKRDQSYIPRRTAMNLNKGCVLFQNPMEDDNDQCTNAFERSNKTKTKK
jgi:hypothetical protein